MTYRVCRAREEAATGLLRCCLHLATWTALAGADRHARKTARCIVILSKRKCLLETAYRYNEKSSMDRYLARLSMLLRRHPLSCVVCVEHVHTNFWQVDECPGELEETKWSASRLASTQRTHSSHRDDTRHLSLSSIELTSIDRQI